MRRHHAIVVLGVAFLLGAVFAPTASVARPEPLLYSDGTWNISATQKLTFSAGYVNGNNALEGAYVFHGSNVIAEKPAGQPWMVDQPSLLDVTGPAKVTISFSDVSCHASYSSTSKGVDHVDITGGEVGGWDVAFADAGGNCESKRLSYDPDSPNFFVHVAVSTVS